MERAFFGSILLDLFIMILKIVLYTDLHKPICLKKFTFVAPSIFVMRDCCSILLFMNPPSHTWMVKFQRVFLSRWSTSLHACLIYWIALRQCPNYCAFHESKGGMPIGSRAFRKPILQIVSLTPFSLETLINSLDSSLMILGCISLYASSRNWRMVVLNKVSK